MGRSAVMIVSTAVWIVISQTVLAFHVRNRTVRDTDLDHTLYLALSLFIMSKMSELALITFYHYGSLTSSDMIAVFSLLSALLVIQGAFYTKKARNFYTTSSLALNIALILFCLSRYR